MTDEELDALVAMLQQRDKSKHGYSGHPLYNRDGPAAADAITTLRAQLASANSRADRAEAALAEIKQTLGAPDDWHPVNAVKALKQSNDRAEAALAEAKEETKDAISTLDSWFDRRELGHKAVDQAVLDAASGYLRTSRSGGMPQKKSDLVLAVFQDMARLGAFADLFARAAKTQVDAALAAQIVEDAGMLQYVADNWDCGHEVRYCRCAELAEQWGIAADEILAQPHDRTALDRMLAEAEERGYEIAKAEAARAGWHLRRYDLAKRDAGLANAQP